MYYSYYMSPEEKLSDIQEEYYDVDFEDTHTETLKEKIARYEALVDTIKKGG